MNRWLVEEVIEDVCKARGLTVEEVCARDRAQQISAARRAIAVIVWDKFRMSGPHNSQCTWGEVARMMGMARSSLHSAARTWRHKEGSQDGKEEERLREKGCLLQQGQESIHEMAQRLCKRRLGEMPQGRRKELGYWRQEGKVNHG